MTLHETAASGAATAAAVTVERAHQLVEELARDPWGQVEPSIYETGRLVALAPWVPGHGQRIDYLLGQQRPDGGWGGPEGYALVPTLSAVEALLAVLHPAGASPHAVPDGADAAGALRRGLRALAAWLDGVPAPLPDTPAVDLIVPALVESINNRLDRIRADSPSDPDVRSFPERLPLPPVVETGRLALVRRRLAAGASVPQKLLHALEVVGEVAGRADVAHPLPLGTVGASPAATAAWLTARRANGQDAAARDYLGSVVRRYGGPVPCTTPVAVFERSWVLANLARAGIVVEVPPEVLASISGALGPTGAATGPGLPTDADTTSVALYVLGRLGVPADPASLLHYGTASHFATWPGEDGYSITTNAHVLEALGRHVDGGADEPYRQAVLRLSEWLPSQQGPEGGWLDRWHASPYYATGCCALALDGYGRGSAPAEAVDRAVDWLLRTQRADGGWGRWGTTVEETAYAVDTLLGLRRPRSEVEPAARRGYARLREALAPREAGGRSTGPALWHDKDLYFPGAIVRSIVLAAMYRAERRFGMLG